MKKKKMWVPCGHVVKKIKWIKYTGLDLGTCPQCVKNEDKKTTFDLIDKKIITKAAKESNKKQREMMKRQIKFRIFSEGKMYPVIRLELEGTIKAYVDSFTFVRQPKHLMQFTGLLDKNGKEIYEGDIIKFQMIRKVLANHPVMTATMERAVIYQGVVEWGEFGWRPFIDGKIEDIEVIGNIYSNPELLKGKYIDSSSE